MIGASIENSSDYGFPPDLIFLVVYDFVAGKSLTARHA